MIADGSPVELFELEGETLWKKPQGPSNVSLEKCDLGLGPGVLKGAYARLPRYFKDADRVMDLETRLLHCMTILQGRSREDATKRVFGNENQPSEMEYLGLRLGTIARHEDGGREFASQGKGSLRARQGDVFPSRRRLGHVLRELPWRGRQAHPDAGPAGAIQARVRAPDCRYVAGLSGVEQPVQDHAMAHQRLLPPDALSRAEIRLGRHYRAQHVSRSHRGGRAVPGPERSDEGASCFGVNSSRRLRGRCGKSCSAISSRADRRPWIASCRTACSACARSRTTGRPRNSRSSWRRTS